jgi:hypothetical protein
VQAELEAAAAEEEQFECVGQGSGSGDGELEAELAGVLASLGAVQSLDADGAGVDGRATDGQTLAAGRLLFSEGQLGREESTQSVGVESTAAENVVSRRASGDEAIKGLLRFPAPQSGRQKEKPKTISKLAAKERLLTHSSMLQQMKEIEEEKERKQREAKERAELKRRRAE